MALFDKLFSTKRKLDEGTVESRDRSSREITLEQVRLLLFKECDWRGRKLLFDSSTINRVPVGTHGRTTDKQYDMSNVIEISEGFAYVYKGPAEDASALGEMIFGAVAMSYRGVSLKIHIMDDPQRLMCAKVFCVPSGRKCSKSERKVSSPESDYRCNSSDLISRCVNMTDSSIDFENNLSFDRKDSGFSCEYSPNSSVSSTYDYFSMLGIWDGNTQDDFYSFHSPPGRKLSTSSNGSWQRRTFRSIATRFSLGQSANMLTVPSNTTNDSQILSSTSGTCDSLLSTTSSVSSQRKNKLGLALLISVTDATQMDLVQRCVEHSPQLQSLVCRLRVATMEAGSGNNGFVDTLYEATLTAARWLSDLIYGPRIQPAWLSLVSAEVVSASAADSIITDLCSVLTHADTKHTKFFVSTLLTHVLTYHLGWVTTVSPYDVAEPHIHQEVKRPYNALWAQLTDLCGNIGFPPRNARTIIYGKSDHNFINKLLVVLTYFIRCGEVKRSKFDFQYNKEKSNHVTVVDVKPKTCGLKRTKTRASALTKYDSVDCLNLKVPSVSHVDNMLSNPVLSEHMTSQKGDSSSLSSEEDVVFVLGDNEKLVGLKNKANCSKKEVANESNDSPSRCCSQQSQHSKPLKHSGFKFEFDKYPQIVTNYMKSKNLEILDRHYLGKPGNLKLDNFQFDPMVVQPLQEEKCEICLKCQMMESNLQTPTNASELEYTNDVPEQAEQQYAKVVDSDKSLELETKTFVRKRKENTVIVNVRRPSIDTTGLRVSDVVEIPMAGVIEESCNKSVGFDNSLLGGITSHYVPDLILQGTLAEPNEWEKELNRDLGISSYLNKTVDAPVHSVAIVGDTSKWEVSIRGCSREVGGMSALVGAMLDALPHMRRASLPAAQCLYFIEGKLREFCVLSKTLADMLMSTELCDMATLTKSLNIDMNDVPLLLAVAATHTPQVATRYGISFTK